MFENVTVVHASLGFTVDGNQTSVEQLRQLRQLEQLRQACNHFRQAWAPLHETRLAMA